MALVTNIQPIDKERNTVHGPTHCSYTIFTRQGQTYLQLDTYGSATRKFKDKISQSIQFNVQSAKQLKRLIESAFPELKL